MRHFGLTLFLLTLMTLSSGVRAAGTDVPAGFAPGPVWLSQSTPTAGNTVRLYTVVYNSSLTAIEGSVTFMVDKTELGSVPFSLDAGESTIKSVDWNAEEGTHEFSAHISGVIERSTKVTATVERAVAAPLSITILPPQPQPKAVDTEEATATSTPTIASMVSAATKTTESLRTAGEAYLTSLVQGAGETDSEPTKQNYTKQAATWALPLFRYPALFYPFFLLLIFLAFWILAKRLRNPKRR